MILDCVSVFWIIHRHILPLRQPSMNSAMILLDQSRFNLLLSFPVILNILCDCLQIAIWQSFPLTIVNVSLSSAVSNMSICQIKSIIFILNVIDEYFWACKPFKADRFNTKICVVLNNKMMKPCQFVKPVIQRSHSMTVVDTFISNQKLNWRSTENSTVKTVKLH